MLRQIVPAEILQMGLEWQGNRVGFTYKIDDRFAGVLSATYPFDLNEQDRSLLPAIALGAAVFVAQLCLPRKIHLDFPCSDSLVQRITPLLQMLYDIRCWKDRLDLMQIPDIICNRGNYHPVCFVTDGSRHACLLWSGGKDSALSTIVLQKNGFQVHPVHLTANARVETSEAQATAWLGAHFGLPYDTILYEFPDFLDIARQYADTWDTFPHYNPVPFGRDLIIALLATLIAKHHRATYLCLGHELDSRSAHLTYHGKRIARCELESVEGEESLAKYIHAAISPTMKFLPPVGGLSEYRTLHEMYTHYPEVMAHVSFCFWGHACGRCAKCLRYYLVARVMGKENVVSFDVNPLEGDNCPDLIDYFENWQLQGSGALHHDEVFYCLARLVERNDIRHGETPLRRFAQEVYPYTQVNLDQVEVEMMRPVGVSFFPDDFRLE